MFYFGVEVLWVYDCEEVCGDNEGNLFVLCYFGEYCWEINFFDDKEDGKE